MQKKLAIITTHPIQYNAPLFALIAARAKIEIKVFYTWGQQVMENKFDPGFGKEVKWDIPLLEGYAYSFVNNIAPNPGSHHFKGIDNPSLLNEIENWKATAVLIYGWSFKSHLRAMRHFKNKIPVYFRGDSTLIQQPGFLKKLIRKLYLTRVYKNIDLAFYVGTNNKAYYRNFGLQDKQLTFAPHAIDNNRFSNISSNDEAEVIKLKNKIGIENYEVVFLFVGKLEEKKNVSLLLQAFSKINNHRVGLLIVGNGALEKEYKTEFEKVENIHFMDFQNQSNMPIVYRLGDVLVLPSKGPSETWGLAINEAMASGSAVLASSDCGAAIDLIKDGINGYIFKSEDGNDLGEKLKLLIKQKENLTAFGSASREIIKNWCFENICEALETQINKQQHN